MTPVEIDVENVLNIMSDIHKSWTVGKKKDLFEIHKLMSDTTIDEYY